MGCNFTVLAFRGAGDAPEPEVAYSENIIGFILQDDGDEVARFQRIYDSVWDKAMGAEASVDTMRRAQAQLTT